MTRHRAARSALVSTLMLAGCAAPAPAGSEPASSRAVHCADVAADRCAEVAEAAELMLGTEALTVEPLPRPSDAGLRVTERFLVRLAPDDAGDDLVEVVRFEGRPNWSVRRLAARPSADG